ncbi:hypothetical protein Cni_G25758 [Canna indica]|uniref:C2H2-type domain-containing protein n=1 Tax=Canna indica TaxID=4628 RepID=A0AAQ3KYH2_9LILI|nr:hypothetical protein Cni_G25758 [Canna indica]
MRGDHQALKLHRCKFCGKSFPCGRSLGGHMRSHMPSTCLPQEAADNPAQSRRSSIASGTGYTLRENPKRTWRISDVNGEMHDNICRKCGRSFASQISLAGHMKSHSERSDSKILQEMEDAEQQEVAEDKDGILESQSDNELVEPQKRKRSRRLMSIPCSSSSPFNFDEEQESVALSLVMMSKGIGVWFSASSVAESSGRNVVIDSECKGMDEREVELIISRKMDRGKELKNLESDVCDNGFADGDDLRMKESYICDSVDFRHSDESSMNCFFKETKKDILETFDTESSTKLAEIDVQKTPKKKSRYQCLLCNKSFRSYQALGGHRSSHMRMKASLESRTEGNIFKNTIESNAYDEVKQIGKNVDKNAGIGIGSKISKKAKEFRCTICFKVFSSGQALGGHKGSHFH